MLKGAWGLGVVGVVGVSALAGGGAAAWIEAESAVAFATPLAGCSGAFLSKGRVVGRWRAASMGGGLALGGGKASAEPRRYASLSALICAVTSRSEVSGEGGASIHRPTANPLNAASGICVTGKGSTSAPLGMGAFSCACLIVSWPWFSGGGFGASAGAWGGAMLCMLSLSCSPRRYFQSSGRVAPPPVSPRELPEKATWEMHRWFVQSSSLSAHAVKRMAMRKSLRRALLRVRRDSGGARRRSGDEDRGGDRLVQGSGRGIVCVGVEDGFGRWSVALLSWHVLVQMRKG